MKIIKILTISSLLLIGSAATSNAWFKFGTVYCDANTNGIIDTGDVPVQSVLVVVTNQSGSFSNATWTDINGQFLVALPDVPDQFVDFIHPAT
jgi:hypothetical protein